MEHRGQECHQAGADHEARHAEADHRDALAQAVDGPARLEGAEDAEQHADELADDHGGDGELQGHRQRGADQ